MSPNGHADVRTHEVPVPEPDLTPDAIIGRARALIPRAEAALRAPVPGDDLTLAGELADEGLQAALRRAVTAIDRGERRPGLLDMGLDDGRDDDPMDADPADPVAGPDRDG
ncbi:MAG: hypothetical protein ACRDOU_14855 [Streptosporangiaceae bacterium]